MPSHLKDCGLLDFESKRSRPSSTSRSVAAYLEAASTLCLQTKIVKDHKSINGIVYFKYI